MSTISVTGVKRSFFSGLGGLLPAALLALSALAFTVMPGMPCAALALAEVPGQPPNTVVYLNGPDKSPYNLTFTISSIEARRTDGVWTPLVDGPLKVNSIDMLENQVLLDELSIPPGVYDRIRFKYARAIMMQERGKRPMELSFPEEGTEFNYDFTISDNDLQPIFISWEVDRCIQSKIHLAPCFAFSGKASYVPEGVGYVTATGSDAVYVFDRRRNFVVSTIRTEKSPKGLAMDQEAGRLFVVDSGSDSMSVIDTSYGTVLNNVDLELSSRAERIAITRDREKLYITNSNTDSVSVVDATSLEIQKTISVGLKPVYVVANPKGDKVYVVNYNSNNVTIIDTITDEVIKTVSVDLFPEKAGIGEDGDKLYVVSTRSGVITIMSASSGNVLKTLRVLDGPLAVLQNPRNSNRLYVTSEADRVSLYDILLENDILESPTGRHPYELEIDSDQGRLYVVNRDSDSVDVFSLLTLKKTKTIQVGKRPWQIVIAN